MLIRRFMTDTGPFICPDSCTDSYTDSCSPVLDRKRRFPPPVSIGLQSKLSTGCTGPSSISTSRQLLGDLSSASTYNPTSSTTSAFAQLQQPLTTAMLTPDDDLMVISQEMKTMPEPYNPSKFERTRQPSGRYKLDKMQRQHQFTQRDSCTVGAGGSVDDSGISCATPPPPLSQPPASYSFWTNQGGHLTNTTSVCSTSSRDSKDSRDKPPLLLRPCQSPSPPQPVAPPSPPPPLATLLGADGRRCYSPGLMPPDTYPSPHTTPPPTCPQLVKASSLCPPPSAPLRLQPDTPSKGLHGQIVEGGGCHLPTTSTPPTCPLARHDEDTMAREDVDADRGEEVRGSHISTQGNSGPNS